MFGPRYSETIYWKEIIALFLIIGAFLIATSAKLYLEQQEEDWKIGVFIGFPLGIIMLLLAVNFRKLDIVMTDEILTVRFGLAKKVIPLANIEKAMTDKEAKPFTMGFGIHMTRYEGEWVQVYNVIFARRAVVKLREGKARYFVFSTREPERVVDLINANLHKAKPDGQ